MPRVIEKLQNVMSRKEAIFLNHINQSIYTLLSIMPFSSKFTDRIINRSLCDESLLVSDAPLFLLPHVLAQKHYRALLNIHIDPSKIKKCLPSIYRSNEITTNFRHYFLGTGHCTNGARLLTQHSLHKEAVELFVYRDDFRSMPSYQKLLERVKNDESCNHNKINFINAEILDNYFTRYLTLLESIEHYGLLPRNELKRQRITLNNFGVRSRYLEVKEGDIGIAIGEDGTLFRFRGGFHRFAFCQQLGLDSIPVSIKFIHINWLKKFHADSDNIESMLRCAISTALQ